MKEVTRAQKEGFEETVKYNFKEHGWEPLRKQQQHINQNWQWT